MNKATIFTADAPAAIGPYSQAVKNGNLVFLSGQIPLDPKSMQIVSPQIAEQTEQVFANLAAVCQAAGGTLQNIVKLNIYLCDLSHFDTVNQIMEKHFHKPYPARAAVQVAALPKGAQIEIEGMMVI